MACINADGTLTPTSQAIISLLKTPSTAVEIGRLAVLPIYRVRSTIRELIEAKLVIEIDGKFQLTESGYKRLLP